MTQNIEIFEYILTNSYTKNGLNKLILLIYY